MRLIDADAFKAYMRGALEQTRRCYPDGGEWAEAVTEEFCRDIDEQPTAQPEIIRCKDCKNYLHDEEYGFDWCNRMSGVFRAKPDGFCSWADMRPKEGGI